MYWFKDIQALQLRHDKQHERRDKGDKNIKLDMDTSCDRCYLTPEKVKKEWKEVKKDKEKLVGFLIAILVMEGYTPEMAEKIMDGQEWKEEITPEEGSTLEDKFKNEWDREERILSNYGKEVYEEYKRKKIIKGISNDEMTENETE